MNMNPWWDILGGLLGVGFGLRGILCHERDAEKAVAWATRTNRFFRRFKFLRWLVDKEPTSVSATSWGYFGVGIVFLFYGLHSLIRGIRGLIGL